MRALRGIAIILLVCVGLVTAAGAVLWSGSLAGLARAEVVSTGAMAPSFEAGDLVVVTARPAAELTAGDVVSVRSPGTGAGHLERVVSASPASSETWTIITAARSGGSTTEHTIGTEVWAPSLRVPVVGGVVSTMLQPSYAIPALAVVLLLGAVVLVGRAPTGPVRTTA
ncbi:hypothetical protein SAMN04487783_2655 [Agrococcus baldri]|uniref:Signal peptidase I n=1 Tax=Agrococcus baldri TaxID=153730 RepID=A0AA94HQ04_9MICO|nr:S26 family signal peptidase [Agrococcus baldri]SFS18481.1 hypothetical protein SAMN04487783_2655 [Agrococcus baldri]